MKRVQLSERLLQLAKMVSPGNRVADVGCDHGFLSIYLVQQNIAPKVLAMDVRKGPLSRAREHVAFYGLEEYIETRLSDGLSNMIAGEADALVCAGMGGPLMEKILSADWKKTRSFQELILQPQSDIGHFRSFLRQNGYHITQEEILKEEGKYYFPIKAVYREKESENDLASRQQEMQSVFDTYGELLIRQKNPLLKEYLLWQRQQLLSISGGLEKEEKARAMERLTQIHKEISGVEQLLKLMEA